MSKKSPDDSSAIKRACDSTLSGREDRSTVRLRIQFLKCNLGAVIDLSLGGIRVRSRCSLQGRHMVKLYNSDHCVRVKAEVRRSERIGFCKHVVGLEFVDVEPEAVETLRILAQQGSL